jgi:uncharacterized protein YacL (UPF0231 family)
MEYQYQLDPATGNARALFSFEHEIFGPWLEVEIGNDVDKLTEVLKAIDDINHGKLQEVVISGSEYSVIIDQQDVMIKTNMSLNHNLNGQESLIDGLTEQGLSLDDDMDAMCGLEDFHQLILSWSKFVTK